MPRYARIHVTGGLFHVISRFQDRRYYLDLKGARAKYLELIGKALETHDCRVIAYCLMSSHVHLVLQLGNDSIGKLTKKIHSPFATFTNRQRKGIGVVMADRPKSVLVHTETYGMELISYVHNNPVRAGVVDRAADSSWSSHRAYLGLGDCPPWLATEAVFGGNAVERETIRQELAGFVDESREEGRRPEFSGELSNKLARRIRKLLGGDVELSYPVLGPDDFIVNVLKGQAKRHQKRQRIDVQGVSPRVLVGAVFEAAGLDPKLAKKRVKSSSVARCRALVAWIWVERFGWPQVEVAGEIGVRPCTVSVMMSNLRRDGLSRKETILANQVVRSFWENTDEKTDRKTKTKRQPSKKETPTVLLLRRNRKKR